MSDLMKKISEKEREQIFKEFCDNLKPHTKAHTFEEALDDCKRAVARQYKKEVLKQNRNKLTADEKHEMIESYRHSNRYSYTKKVLSGEINPPSAASQRRFVAVITRKYGSLTEWHLMRSAAIQQIDETMEVEEDEQGILVE